ncbi:MAG: HNH endonuclease [Planctomycetes bacterium]|nr:HNH endonuclease [Planctomycetota bacterium]
MASLSPSAGASSPPRNTVTVRIWSAGGGTGGVHVHLVENELPAAALHVGDDVVLDIRGAIVRGVVSKDDKGVWLGTKPLKPEWSHQRITDALLSVGVTNPSTLTASVVARNGLGTSTADPEVLRQHADSMTAAGVVDLSRHGNLAPLRVERVVVDFQRDPGVRATVLRAADGRCEQCGQPAPFLRDDETPFLEVHHVVTLAEGGSDTPDNAVALCPNCHRFMHFGAAADRAQALAKLRASVQRLLGEQRHR